MLDLEVQDNNTTDRP